MHKHIASIFLFYIILLISSCGKPIATGPRCYTISGTLYSNCNHEPFANQAITVVATYWKNREIKSVGTVVDTIQTNSKGEFTVDANCGDRIANEVFIQGKITLYELQYNTSPLANSYNVNDTSFVKIALTANNHFTLLDTLYYKFHSDTTYHFLVGPFSSGYVETLKVASHFISINANQENYYINWAIGYNNLILNHGNQIKIIHTPCSAPDSTTITLN